MTKSSNLSWQDLVASKMKKVLLVRERTLPVVGRHEPSIPRDGRSQTK